MGPSVPYRGLSQFIVTSEHATSRPVANHMDELCVGKDLSQRGHHQRVFGGSSPPSAICQRPAGIPPRSIRPSAADDGRRRWVRCDSAASTRPKVPRASRATARPRAAVSVQVRSRYCGCASSITRINVVPERPAPPMKIGPPRRCMIFAFFSTAANGPAFRRQPSPNAQYRYPDEKKQAIVCYLGGVYDVLSWPSGKLHVLSTAHRGEKVLLCRQ